MTDTAASPSVEDRMAIEQLEAAYCKLFDERDADAWAALFTADGRYRSRGVPPDNDGSRGVHLIGREALATFCRTAPFTGVHLVHLPLITVDGDVAIGRLHFEHVGAFDGRDGLSRSVGFYDVRYERVDGRWLFADKVTTVFAVDGTLIDGYPPSAFAD